MARGQTPSGFSYPEPDTGEPANVPADLKRLAEDVERVAGAKALEALLAGFEPGGGSPPPVVVHFVAASASWVIEHNLDARPVEVTTFDSTGELIYGDVTYPGFNATNTVEVRWGFAMTGTAIVRK